MSYYDITLANLAEVAKAAYDLSEPKGMGFLHFTPGALPDEHAEGLVKVCEGDPHIALHIDYLHGRCCKLVVFRRREQLFVQAKWYDHTESQMRELLRRIGCEGAPLVEALPEAEA